MILHSLTLKGISSAFPDEVSIDFDAAGEGLIALVGDNGQGKTTLMEGSGPATLYRTWPSYRETFAAKVLPGTELAYSDLTFTLGAHRYRCRVQVDATHNGGKGKTEAWLWRDDAPKPIAGERVGEVDRELVKILPAIEVLLASNFACQSREGSFFELPKAERKALFIELLGLAHLQTLAELARGDANQLTDELERVRAELTRAQASADRAAELDAQIAALTADVARLTDARDAAAARLDDATAAATATRERLAGIIAEADQRAADKARLEGALSEADATAQRANETLAGLAAVLGDAAQIRAAVASLTKIDEQIGAASATQQRIAGELEPLRVELTQLVEQQAAAREQWKLVSAAKMAAQQAAALIAAAGDLSAAAEAAKAQVAAARAEHEQAQTRLSECERDAADAQTAKATRDSLTREWEGVKRRRDAFSAIDLANPMCAECPLTADAKDAAARLTEINTQLAGLQLDDEAGARRDRQAETVRRLAAELQTLEAAANEAVAAAAVQQADRERAALLDQTVLELQAIEQRGGELKTQIEALDQRIAALQSEAAAIGVDALRAERATVAPVAGRLPALEVAEAQRGALTHTIETAQQKAAALGAELAAIVVPDVSAARQEAETAEATRADAAAAVTAATEALAPPSEALQMARGERAALGDAEAQAAALRAREAVLAREAADFALLDRAFGRNGIQALEIDSAGPAVTAIANDLLSSCYGSRFQLRIDTTEPSKSKKGAVKEVFDVTILDAEAGREGKRGSGGEQVILDEALRLAIAIFNAQKSGGAIRTLWRDETAGALSPANASRYVQMLRRARVIGGFWQVIFVSHSEAVWSQADAKVFVAGGRVTQEAA